MSLESRWTKESTSTATLVCGYGKTDYLNIFNIPNYDLLSLDKRCAINSKLKENPGELLKFQDYRDAPSS
jgi:hypothetical protein